MNTKNKHYSNILIVAPDGQPLGSIGEKKMQFYVKGNLVDKVDPILGFTEVYRLKFEPEGRTIHTHHIEPRENKCVVTGEEEDLSLHHVVPYFIKKRLPKKYADHTCHWCVLLTRTVHDKIEIMNDTLYDTSLARYMGKHPIFLDHTGIKQSVNMLEQIPFKYWKEMPLETRNRWNMLYLSYQGSETLSDRRENVLEQLKQRWVDEFIDKCGGIEEMFLTYKKMFLTLKPEYLPKGYLEMEFE
jgi:hypothetical protein